MTSSLPLIRRLTKEYLYPQAGVIAVAVVLMIISAAMTGIIAKMMETIIDSVFAAPAGKQLLWMVALGVFVVFAVRGFASYGQSVLMNKAGQRVVADMQRTMFGHLVYADLSYFHGQQSGQLMSRFISDMTMIRIAVMDSVVGLGKNTFTLIFLIGVMVYQDYKLAFVSLFAFPAAAYTVMRLGKKLRKASTNAQVETGLLASMLGQAFQGSKHIKAYGAEEFEKARIGNTVERVYNLLNRQYRTSAIAQPMSEILSGLAIVMIIVYGGTQVLQGASTTGKLFSFIAAFLLAYEPMKRLAKLNSTMQMGLAALDRFYKLIDIEPAIRAKQNAIALRAPNPTVAFENVSFIYPDGTQALDHVSFTVPAGRTVALVGESGAGKSTVLSLLPRFYDVTSGTITIDGTDIRDVTIESLRAHIGIVSQEVAVFNDTIRDNIAYGMPDVPEEQVVRAAKQAAAHDFILELPDGYNTIVGENGVKLSGGQRQRISIARAMLKNAPILLLDEATSALDTNSERLVQSALETLQEGRTTIVVAHRLSTIMNADIIFVLSEGRIAESGSHAELIERKGVYSRLYGNLLKESA